MIYKIGNIYCDLSEVFAISDLRGDDANHKSFTIYNTGGGKVVCTISANKENMALRFDSSHTEGFILQCEKEYADFKKMWEAKIRVMLK